MGLVGVKKLNELNSSYITTTMPVRMAHEHSAFPHLPGERLV